MQRNYPSERAAPRPVPWADVRRLAGDGMNARQIVDALCLPCTPGALRHNGGKRGIVIRAATYAERTAAREGRYQVWTEQTTATLATMWEAGETASAIGRAVGCSHRSVMEKAARMGLTRRLAKTSAAPPPPDSDIAARLRRRAALLPLPELPGPVLPAIRQMLGVAA